MYHPLKIIYTLYNPIQEGIIYIYSFDIELAFDSVEHIMRDVTSFFVPI